MSQIQLETVIRIQFKTASQVKLETVASAEILMRMMVIPSDTWRLFMHKHSAWDRSVGGDAGTIGVYIDIDIDIDIDINIGIYSYINIA